MANNLQELSAWLEQQYLAWQQKKGRRVTLTQFAKQIGISPALLSHYMNGIRKPTRENVHKIANLLGPEIYDILGHLRPDTKLQYISRNWGKLSTAQQQHLIEWMEKSIEDQNREDS
ncbi:MAG: helix-turn-helix transcriptional regulator [Anaerolineales bacterium]|nr:helix-turn-helix transcriptional regulator [Anaerolineales bacterium]